ncbi:MAG: hypothetical protein J4215_04695 [Candidatus Diapherotrites archaeon]|uniref:Uncharacterized protein n=1 Tax=Candidatus Iainarchaeum sp. TaxID=3101447 RepID=A0A8T4L4V5_9ARCH|nr:hypothetical protein [Candidatus Diapherotrites archaeon]
MLQKKPGPFHGKKPKALTGPANKKKRAQYRSLRGATYPKYLQKAFPSRPELFRGMINARKKSKPAVEDYFLRRLFSKKFQQNWKYSQPDFAGVEYLQRVRGIRTETNIPTLIKFSKMISEMLDEYRKVQERLHQLTSHIKLPVKYTQGEGALVRHAFNNCFSRISLLKEYQSVAEKRIKQLRAPEIY